jgi:lipoprotein-anchoring transpeptidase ErfK/SrfK
MQSPARQILVDVSAQRLDVVEEGNVIRSFPVSTSACGIGTEPGSNKTPPGRHFVAEKIGGDAPLGAVFRSRVPTGEFGGETSAEDLVQTRILWLAGLEDHNVNSKERYIYIHGTNQESLIGQPASHGCIRMRNADVADLYAMVEQGTEVFIVT